MEKIMANVKPQTQAQAVESLTFELKCQGQTIAVQTAPYRTFASGKHGFGAYGKTMLPDGRALQLSLNTIVIEKTAG